MLRNTITSYGLIAKVFHWSIGFVIIALLAVGYYMTNEPQSVSQYTFYPLHKAMGALVLMLVFLRLLWRLKNITPALSADTPHWQVTAANINTKFLYFLMFAMPLSGIFMSLYGGHNISIFNLFTIPAFTKNPKLSSLAGEFHEAFAVLLIISVSLHIIAAFYHHFIKKDDTLKRMLG